MQFSFSEIFYITLAVTGIMLTTRQHILARPLSLMSTSISLYIYYTVGLYAKCLLNCIYVLLDIYGWHYWLYGGKNRTPLRVSKSPYIQLAALPVLWLLGAWGLGQFFARYSQAAWPYGDSLHTAMALTGQWLTERKKLETWAVWMLADVLYAVVLYHRGLYLLSGLHLFYIILAINGYRAWRRSYRQQLKPISTSPS